MDVIAKKPGAFQVHKCLYPFENEKVVVKALHGTKALHQTVVEEMEKWAKAGYLLAYANTTMADETFTMYLILKLNAPPPASLPWKEAENAMREARTKAPSNSIE